MQYSLCTIVLLVLFLPGLEARARTWTDSTGLYTVQADYLDYKDGKVRLRRADNQKIVGVPFERLSHSDQALIQDLQRQVRAGDKVVTLHPTAVRVGAKVLTTVDAGVEVHVAQVQGRWIGVVVQREGRDIAGWIPAVEVRHAVAGDRAHHVPSARSERLVGGKPSAGTMYPWSAAAIAPVLRRVEPADESDFEQQVLKADVPVLVDFCAEWCGPCRALGPVLEELAREASDVKIVRVDFDRNRNLAARYGVESLPSLLVFKSGQVRDRQVGLAAKARLKSMLNL